MKEFSNINLIIYYANNSVVTRHAKLKSPSGKS